MRDLNKKIDLESLKQQLLEEKERVENELREIAVEVPNKGDGWEAKFPDYGTETAEQEANADEVEEFAADLTLGGQLEERLKDIKAALRKMESGGYGICELCGKPIDIERLKANPEARTHTKC